MIADARCFDCREHDFRLDDCVGETLKTGRTSKRFDSGQIAYFDVPCPECGRLQGVVIHIDTRLRLNYPFTIWPCTWNDEPCQEPDCPYCRGEYVV